LPKRELEIEPPSKDEFYNLLDKNKDIVEKCVFENIYDRHIKRLFDTG
jgi:hypothetical protein